MMEDMLIRVIEDARNAHNAAFKQLGLCIEPPKVIVLRCAPDPYASEIRIDIVQRDTHDLVDCLEFFAFKDGKPQVTGEELRVWLAEQLAALTKDSHRRNE